MPPPDSQIDTTIEIVTPENIAFQYEVAGPFRRLPAFIFDFVIRCGFMAVLMLLLGLAQLPIEILLMVGMLTYFVLEWFYGAFLETYWNGQTLGKRMMGLRVLSIDGQPINGLQGMMRNILRLADLMPLLPVFAGGELAGYMIPTGLIGLVTPLLNRRYQRLGDVVSGTIVVVEEKRRLLAAIKFDDERVKRCAADLPPSLQVGVKMARALAAYAERRKYISPPRRKEIARHLAVPLLEHIHWPPNTDYDLLLCALYYRVFVAEQFDVDASLDYENTYAAAEVTSPSTEMVAVPTQPIDSRSDQSATAQTVATLQEPLVATSEIGQPATPLADFAETNESAAADTTAAETTNEQEGSE